MKTRFILLLCLTTIFFTGCKNEKSEKSIDELPQQEEVATTFNVTLDVIVKKDDNFQVYYNTGSGINEEESVWSAVKGSETPQKIMFKLPEGVIPTSIRIDLGVKDDQEDLTLNSVEMDYLGKKFSTQGAEIAKYFYPLAPSELDFATGIVKAKVKNGKRMEPAFYSNEAFALEINKIIK